MKKFLFCALLFSVFCTLANSAIADTTYVQPQPKSPGKALAWSLFGTIVPIAAGTAVSASTDGAPEVAGIVISNFGYVCGPSLGYFYGGLNKRGWTGNAIRGGLYGTTVVLVLSAEDNGRVKSDDGAVIMAGVVAIVLIVDDIIDIAKVDGAVRKHNQSLNKTGWIIVPTYFAKHKTGGLKLQILF